MSNNRIIYRDWMVELGGDPRENDFRTRSFDSPECVRLTDKDVLASERDSSRAKQIQAQVQNALAVLTDEEQEFVIRFYFMGETYRQISEKSGRAVHRLESLHRRSVRKLKKELAIFVSETFGLNSLDKNRDCPLCTSPHVTEINRIIAARDRTQTWRPIIKTLREQFGIKVSSPQLLIGHERYHISNQPSSTGKGKTND